MPDETANGEDVLANEPRYTDNEQKAINALERLVEQKHEEIIVLAETQSRDWRKDSARELSDHLDEDRIEELEAGAEPSEEERDLWFQHLSNEQEYWERLILFRVFKPEGDLWIWMVMDGEHQGSVYLDGAGPFPSLEEAMPSFLAYLGRWYQWYSFTSIESELSQQVYDQAVAHAGEPFEW